MGVCESDKTDSRPLERQRTVAFDKLLLGVALGKRDEDTITTLAGRLARLDREITKKDALAIKTLTGGTTLVELSTNLLSALDPDVIAERATGIAGSSPDEVKPEKFESVRQELIAAACDPFDKPELRDALAKIKKEAEQIIDTVTIDAVVTQGFDAAAKEKAESLIKTFREYIEEHRPEIEALQILYSRPYKQRLTEPMLKDLEEKLRAYHAAWTEDRLWDAFAVTAPAKVKGRSQPGRFADLVSLVRFSLEQQPVLEPFAESVNARFEKWLSAKKAGGNGFTPDHIAWLHLIRDHIATSLSIEPEDFDYAPFSQRGGLGKAHQLFGDQLPQLLEELNEVLAA